MSLPTSKPDPGENVPLTTPVLLGLGQMGLGVCRSNKIIDAMCFKEDHMGGGVKGRPGVWGFNLNDPKLTSSPK